MERIRGIADIHKGEMAMLVQPILDDLLRSHRYRSVSDLQYISSENLVYVQRKMGFKSTVVDISKDDDEESLIRHLASVPAIY